MRLIIFFKIQFKLRLIFGHFFTCLPTCLKYQALNASKKAKIKLISDLSEKFDLNIKQFKNDEVY